MGPEPIALPLGHAPIAYSNEKFPIKKPPYPSEKEAFGQENTVPTP